MLIDRTHKPWFVVSAVIGVAAGSAYWALSRAMPHGVTGGSVAGLLFGIIGSAMMVFTALLAVRKRLPTWRVGSAQWWLRGHLWLGTLGFVLILFHSGFGWGGLLENLLWISFGLVVVTGFAGVALQHVIPKLLTTRVPLETMVSQIPFLSQTNLFRADQLVAKHAGPLDIPFEPLKSFAEEALKQQRVLKRESDFPKELAKVYLGVGGQGLGVSEPHKEEGVRALGLAVSEPQKTLAMPVSASPTPNPQPLTPSAKSPLELMREKAAAAKAGSSAAEAPASQPASPESALPAKPLSPIEIMKAKAAAKKAAETAVSPTPAAAASDAGQSQTPNASHGVDSPTNTSPTEAKPLSPLEQMKAKMAAKAGVGESGVGVSEPQSTSNDAALSSPTPNPQPLTPVKKSPLEIMQAKLAAQKGSTSDKLTDVPKPLTVAKPEAAVTSPAKLSPLEIMKAKMAKPVGDVTPRLASAPSTVDATPAPVAAKNLPSENASRGATSPTPKLPVASSPPKPKPVAVIPAAALAQLRDFHLRAVRPFLDNGWSASSGLNDVLAARRLFGQLKSDLPAELHETLEQLEAWCEERRQFNTQLQLHRWLHWWLVLHIPSSFALLVLFVVHVVVSLRVVPWGK